MIVNFKGKIGDSCLSLQNSAMDLFASSSRGRTMSLSSGDASTPTTNRDVKLSESVDGRFFSFTLPSQKTKGLFSTFHLTYFNQSVNICLFISTEMTDEFLLTRSIVIKG